MLERDNRPCGVLSGILVFVLQATGNHLRVSSRRGTKSASYFLKITKAAIGRKIRRKHEQMQGDLRGGFWPEMTEAWTRTLAVVLRRVKR